MEKIKETLTLSQLVKEDRAYKKLTLLDYAKKVGTNKTTISLIEKGKSKLTLQTLIKLSIFMKVDIAILVKAKEKEGIKWKDYS